MNTGNLKEGMKSIKLLMPALLVMTFVSAPAHAGLLEWLFGGGQDNHQSFRACTHAVFKRDNHRGHLDREYIAAQCKKFVRNAEDECEMGRLLDVKHGHEYSCSQSGYAEVPPHPGGLLDLCWDRIFCD
jgi:hypothetical protein